MTVRQLKLSPVVEYMRQHWDKVFRLGDLVAAGFGDKHYVTYHLQKSKYVKRVGYGRYQFTPYYVEDVKTPKEEVGKYLDEHPRASMAELVEHTGYAYSTCKRAIQNVAEERGMDVVWEYAARLIPRE